MKRGVFYGDLPMLSPRVPYLTREKAAYIKLRRIGLSINQIAAAFGRSVSCIHRIIKRAEAFGLRRFDIRKLPPRIRRMSASLRWQTLLALLSKWEAWIAGEGEQPP